MIARRLPLALASLALAAGLGACGNKQDKITEAETEGVYVDVGGLKYQVQISRQLNPRDSEDREFLTGVTEKPGADEAWFAVFIRAENDGDTPHRTAEDYEIEDTQGNEFRPLSMVQTDNPYAYRPKTLLGHKTLPGNNETAAQTSINGQLLLFKVPRSSFDDRPRELRIHDPDDPESIGTVNFDVWPP